MMHPDSGGEAVFAFNGKAEDAKGTLMSTITITDADVGRTIATNGTLTAIGFMQAPTPGTYAYPDGLLSLVDDANPNGSPRALFHADVTTQWWSPKHPLYKSAHLVHDAQGVSSPLF